MVDKTIFVSGSFNVLHPGHIRLLRFAKDMKGKLIVGVISDRYAGKAAYINEKLRLEGISSNNLVDEALIIDESIEDFIRKSGSAGSFVVFRSDENKESELGIDEV